METDTETQLAQEIERELYERHGATLGGPPLYRALGFPTAAAMRQAVSRGRMPVSLFDIEGRRGRFALTREVARWLASCRTKGLTQSPGAQRATNGSTKEDAM